MRRPSPEALEHAADWLFCYNGEDGDSESQSGVHTVAEWLLSLARPTSLTRAQGRLLRASARGAILKGQDWRPARTLERLGLVTISGSVARAIPAVAEALGARVHGATESPLSHDLDRGGVRHGEA